MKRFTAVFLIIALALSLSSCAKEFKKADEQAVKYVEALLQRDEEEMSKYIHPDHKDSAIPDDAFYADLEEQKLPVGMELTALEAGTKNYVENTSLEGTVLQCNYILRANELFYNVELIILDNDKGYGVVAVKMSLNLEYLSAVLSEA